jgi:L-fuculose-phosphate aldolase
MHDQAAEMCRIGRRAYDRQLVDGTGGNFSCRLDAQRVLCTPTLCSKGLLEPTGLCIVGMDGRQLDGASPVSSEILLHLAIYAASPETRAVIHCHPPYATTLALLGMTIPDGVLPEGDIFLGPVPLVPYQTPGTPAMGDAIRPFVTPVRSAAILQNHGSVTWGADLASAYAFTETLEAVCRVYYQALQAGTPKLIPESKRGALREIRARIYGPAPED